MEIYSLGMNCEVSFQIEKRLGEIDSSLFSWAFIKDEHLFIMALNNIDDIFENEISFNVDSEDMFMDEKYMIAFHGKTNKKEMLDANGHIYNKRVYNEALEETKSRVKYLKEKFKKSLTSEKNKLFLYKMWIPPFENNVEESVYENVICNISAISEFFKNNAKNYKIVFVLEKKYDKECLHGVENENVKIQFVNFFSPWGDTKNGADDISWTKIFDTFLLEEE